MPPTLLVALLLVALPLVTLPLVTLPLVTLPLVILPLVTLPLVLPASAPGTVAPFMAIDARARYSRDPARYERGMTKLLKATVMDTGR